MAVRMKLQVPLTIAARLWTWFAARPTPSAWMIGIPPPTLPSNAIARPYFRAWAKSLGHRQRAVPFDADAPDADAARLAMGAYRAS